jgi:hypothetical protein
MVRFVSLDRPHQYRVGKLKDYLALFSMVAFIIVTDLFRTSRFPGFDHAQPGTRLSCLLFLYLKISQAQPGLSICCRGSLAFSSYLVLSGLARRLIRVTSGLLATALILASGITSECIIPISFLPFHACVHFAMSFRVSRVVVLLGSL